MCHNVKPTKANRLVVDRRRSNAMMIMPMCLFTIQHQVRLVRFMMVAVHRMTAVHHHAIVAVLHVVAINHRAFMYWAELKFPPVNLWTAPRMESLKSLGREAKLNNVIVKFKSQLDHGEIQLIGPSGSKTSVTYSKAEHRPTAIRQAVDLIHAMRSAG